MVAEVWMFVNQDNSRKWFALFQSFSPYIPGFFEEMTHALTSLQGEIQVEGFYTGQLFRSSDLLGEWLLVGRHVMRNGPYLTSSAVH